MQADIDIWVADHKTAEQCVYEVPGRLCEVIHMLREVEVGSYQNSQILEKIDDRNFAVVDVIGCRVRTIFHDRAFMHRNGHLIVLAPQHEAIDRSLEG